MNKIFKIVFNAARGKMVVVNEATSSVQTGKKAAVTVAVIGALAAGSAMAEDIVYNGEPEITMGSDYTVVISEKEIKNKTKEEANAYGGALIVQGGASVTMNGVTFDGNNAKSPTGISQGGAYHQVTGNLYADNVTFSNNKTEGLSGLGNAVLLNQVDGEISNAKFINNISVDAEGSSSFGREGGALHVSTMPNWGGTLNSSLLIKDSEFTGNKLVDNYYAYGGAIKIGGGKDKATQSVTLVNVAFTENKAENADWGIGGAIHSNNAELIIEGGKFVSNVSTSYGGAIATREDNGAILSSLSVEGTTFEGNKTGIDGGALDNRIKATIKDSTFKSNVAGDWGGAIMNYGTLAVNGGSFEGNSANVGGAIAISKDSKGTVIEGASFSDNKAAADGGAIGAYGALTVKNSVFTGNKAGYSESDATPIGGGAISLGAVSTVDVSSIEGSVFSKNTSEFNGGAIATRRAQDATLKDATYKFEATFTENKAAKSGGAIWNSFYKDYDEAGAGVLVSGTFSKNEAVNNGGAIFNDGWESDANETSDGGVMTVSGTFSENKADWGGAIFNKGTMTIVDSTFEGNVATSVGGAIFNSGTLTLKGTNTFTDNTAAEGNDVYNTGTLNIDGTATFNGGIVSTEGAIVNVVENATVSLGGATDIATLNGSSATLEVTSTTVEIAENNMTETTLVASGSVNDALGGDADALADLVNAAEGSLESVTMAEGEVMGAVTATVEGGVVTGQTVAMNEKTEALAEKVTLAPQMITRIMMNDVRKRMGDIRAAEGTHGVWARYNGGQMEGQGAEADFSMIQVGIDTVPVADAPRFGVAFSYAQSESEDGVGSADMDSFSLAFYGMKMYDNGMFVDVIGRMATMDTDLVNHGYTGKMDNVALSLSGELGWRFDVTDKFFFEPSAELTYTYTNADTFTMTNGGKYELEATDSLVGRAGFAAGFKCPANKGDVYVRAAVVHEFMGDTTMNSWTATGGPATPVEADGEDTYFEYAIGAQFNVNKNTYVYADIERTEGAVMDEDWRANVGARFAF